MPPIFLKSAENPASIRLIKADDWEAARSELQPKHAEFAAAQKFEGSAGQTVMLPGETGKLDLVLFGLGNGKDALATCLLYTSPSPRDA